MSLFCIMISGHVFMYLLVRFLVESFFSKFQVFLTNRIPLTTFCYGRTVAYFYLKIPEGFSRVIFHNSPGWLLLKLLQQIRPCSKSVTKKRVELFKLMLIRCLYRYLGTYFWSLRRSLPLAELQAFPLKSTGGFCGFTAGLRIYFNTV